MKAKVQPYSVWSTMISSPGFRKDQKTAVIAPIPDAVATAASAPSSAAMRRSSRSTVGLAMRL